MRVLKLTAHGLPQAWLTLQQAVLHYAAGDVRWVAGGCIATFRGGINARTGLQTRVDVHAIIGTRGHSQINPFDVVPSLTNAKLFARDRQMCAYCGQRFEERELTREHIVPLAQGGRDQWMNVVTACRACNHRKGNRTPEQARMPLLYAPYVPNLWEDFILRNRRILADQMEFLMAHLPRHSRLHG
ncbi:HNH endonuclease [Tepidimonas sediminis]|uniref:HNH endonuclease n=1 Tax=Tepidimonas sediminis TaxID=2588941 RepID=A0A554WN76_9BURK|nr:HNH endonuclease [Tepidimonas sediminis]TSE25028.1 HNH endonuclease [Tepidimonas sediminis]